MQEGFTAKEIAEFLGADIRGDKESNNEIEYRSYHDYLAFHFFKLWYAIALASTSVSLTSAIDSGS